jgi:hypothetical protein
MRLYRFLRGGIRWLRRARDAWVDARVRRELAHRTDFSYTSDWLSKHLEHWNEHFKPLMGQPDLRALEIGSFEGRSAVWLLEEVLTHPSASLVCIDPFLGAGREARFDHNVALSGQAQRLEKRKGFSEDVLPTLAGHVYDLIYIDGGHAASTVLLDAVLSWRLLRPNGVLVFDDYLWMKDPRASQRPKLAIDLFLEQYAGQYEVLHLGYQVMLRKNTVEATPR